MPNPTNPMQSIYLEKVTLNMGIGSSEEKYEAAKALLNKLTGHSAAPAKAKRRLPEFGIKQGQIIGVMVTLRKAEAAEMLKKALDANNDTISSGAIAGNSLNFGIKEYIYISGVKYDPKIGMFGLNVNATFARKGMRVERRKVKKGVVKKEHKSISREDVLSYLQKQFAIKLSEEE